jgi:hypothetical protein
MKRMELARILRKPGESIPIKFGDPHHDQWIFDMYGGEQIVKEKLPVLYNALRTTALISQGEVKEKETEGFEDGAEIGIIKWDKESHSLVIKASTSLVSKALYIDEKIEVRTSKDEHVATFAQTTKETDHTKLVLCSDFDPADYASNVLEIDYTSHWAEATNGQLKGFLSSRNIESQIYLSGEVKEVHLLKPVKKDSTQESPINICYNRRPVAEEEIDYIYEESFDPAAGKQRLFAPLSAWVEFEDDSDPFRCIDLSTFDLKLDCQNGIARYTKTDREIPLQDRFVKGQDAPAKYTNGFFFDLDPDWKTNVPSNRLPQKDKVDIYFTVQYVRESGDRGSIQISSTLAPPIPSNAALSRCLHILWGCLSKGTKILMADGCERPIETIKIGDLVQMNTNGYTAVVTQCIRGNEKDDMIHFHTLNGLDLVCTKDHPIVTDKGAMRASEVTGNCHFIHQTGEILKLTGIWEVPGDEVYNLELCPQENDPSSKEGCTFFAEGILVGDNNMQALVKAPTNEIFDNPHRDSAAVKQTLWEAMK